MTEQRVTAGTKIALGALIFSVASSAFVWTYADRVADQARQDAVQEAEKSREDADRGLCGLIGDFIRADNPARDDRLRKSLAEAYTDPRCVPPLGPDGKLPPLPSPSVTSTAPPTQEPTAGPTDDPQAGIGEQGG